MLTCISSYISPKWFTFARNANQQQHQKYYQAAEDVKEIFTPLICSADGVIHKEYASFQMRISETLAR